MTENTAEHADPYATIPRSMRAAKRWLLHRKKIPYYIDGRPRNGELDSPPDIARLGTFDDAVARLARGGFDGLGFALGPDGTDHWQGVDLDHLSDHPGLQDLIHDLPGYVERSPSGNGIHAIGRGRNFAVLGSNPSGIEAYSRGRYFTVTGNTVKPNEPVCLANYINAELRPLHEAAGSVRKASVATIRNDIAEFVGDDLLDDLLSALRHIRESADEYQAWTKMGLALKSLGEPGLRLFLDFSAQSDKFDHDQAMRKWEGYAPSSITHKAIFHEAQQRGWVNPRKGKPVVNQSPTARAPLLLTLDSKDLPVPNLSNAMAYLRADPSLVSRVWFSTFQQRVISTFNKEQQPREWSDTDTSMLTEWFQTTGQMPKISSTITGEAVKAVAFENARDECADWLRSLAWDGTPRLGLLLKRGFGAAADAYTESVGRCWMVSMVARALHPGCKVDTMPVFEGAQGGGKSQALQTLVGSDWFAESAEKPDSKDFFMGLTGKLLVEIGEMDSFNKADVNAIKRVMSCRVDRYRPPYGRASVDVPRHGVFAGTTNRDDWNRDETGARRFWPVATGTIDLDWIAASREQLFAEAVALFDQGVIWWDLPADRAADEQEARRQADSWEGAIGAWLTGRDRATVGEIMDGALRIVTGFQTRADQMRVASAMRVLGWVKGRWSEGGIQVRGYSRPGKPT